MTPGKKLQPPFCLEPAERCRIVSAPTYATLIGMAAIFDGNGRPVPARPATIDPAVSLCLTCGREWRRIERNGRSEFLFAGDTSNAADPLGR